MVFRISYGRILILVFCIAFLHLIAMKVSRTVETMHESESKGVLIIDAGHGGDDGGAVSVYSGMKESEINLSISLRLNQFCHLYGVRTVMTRESEKINYTDGANSISERKKSDQKARLRLIWDYPDAILFSIHQNFYPAKSPFGPQVLYGHDDKSAELGCNLQYNLVNAICPQSRRVATEIDNNIYLLRNCNCTSVLIECGFLSNLQEAEMLQNDNYQKKIAAVLVATYLQFVA